LLWPAACSERISALTWTPCTETALSGLDCATLVVPKDYNDSTRGTFSLALARAKATGAASDRIGTLFFNPGGPGSSGVSLVPTIAPALPPELRAHFDFVSWDPRGVGRYSGVSDCCEGPYSLPASDPMCPNANTPQ